MGLLRRMSGRVEAPIEALAVDDAIRLHDADGREYLISRHEYRSKVLPELFRRVQGDSDQLYDAIADALQDGFFAEAVLPARQLLEMDARGERATAVLGIALMRSGELDQAEQLFQSHLREAGASGVILTNLAKVFSERGEDARAEEILWSALEADPNQDNALDWWGAIHREQGGEPAFLRAMERVAKLPGSWRAELWLARQLLQDGKTSQAMLLYESVLPLARASGDALMMISGDLCSKGCLREAIRLIAPIYDPVAHGPMAGLNLAQACIQLGEAVQGRGILAGLERLNQPELGEDIQQLRAQLE